MASCASCNSFILFGGSRHGTARFCNDRCLQQGHLVSISHQIPQDAVTEHLTKLHQDQCPKCQGRGPVDVHNSYQVFSALIMTRWVTKSLVSCRSCGVKSQVGNLFFSLILGWWGFPWGLIMTPVQVTRNIIGIFSGPDPLKPSPQLEKFVRLNIAAHLVQQEQAGRAA